MTIRFLFNSHRKLFGLSLGILLCGCFAFSTVQAKDTWTSVRSKNFFLVGNAGEKDMRKVAARLEQFREVFTRLLPGAKFQTPVPTTVIVFKSMSSYKPFNSGNNAGYFQKGVAYFIVQSGDRTYKIRAVSLGQVQLTAYTPVQGGLSCGSRKTPETVVFTFRPAKEPKDIKAKIDGDAIAVELVPSDFKLKP